MPGVCRSISGLLGVKSRLTAKKNALDPIPRGVTILCGITPRGCPHQTAGFTAAALIFPFRIRSNAWAVSF